MFILNKRFAIFTMMELNNFAVELDGWTFKVAR